MEESSIDEGKGYHLRDIQRGELGESSKIMEELLELQDAEDQGVMVMALVELSDMYGAMRHYLKRYFPGLSMDDLERMADVTERAFKSGGRT